MISLLILGITNSTFIIVAYTMYYYKDNYNNILAYKNKKKWGVYHIEDEDKSSEIINIDFYNNIEDCFYFINDLIKKKPLCTYWIIKI